MRRQQAPPPPVEVPVDTPPDARIVSRPDGYHWLTADGKREIGPFASYEEAEFDMRADEHSDVEPEESLGEAENEIGIAEWIDPDTGQPAEQARPRLEDH
jgi:hypothetical protein